MRSKAAMLLTAMAVVCLSTAAFAQDVFFIRYASNLNIGDSIVNLSNAGSSGSPSPAGNLCANVYVFDPSEELIACCSCLVTPNGLKSLSARSDLISNTLTPAVPTSIVIKLLSSAPVGGSCNAGAPGALAPGLHAWGTTLHPLPNKTYAVTETEFTPAILSAGELLTLTSNCSFIQTVGSGFGICKSCRTGGR